MSWKSTGGLTSDEREKLNKIDVGVKSNLNATAAPTTTDDNTKGYGIGSTWVYNNTTYLCTDATKDKAIWATQEDIYYFATWTDLATAISVIGTTYINKYAVVANANGGPIGGVTYTAPNTINPYIVDGNSATYKILAQGTNYKVQCQARTITNPAITNIYTAATVLPTAAGYYIFTVAPTGGMPVGTLNDILYYDGNRWSIFQTYNVAPSTIVVGTISSSQLLYRKQQGSWRGASVLNGIVTVADIDGSNWTCPVSGDIVSASKSNGGLSSNNRVTVTFPIAMSAGTVLYSIENYGTDYQTAQIGQVVWTRNSSTQITFWFSETSGVTQQIKLHIAVFLR